MRKIVALNSGGFDSIVLMNDLRKSLEPDSEIYSIHFIYGALNEKMQRKCAYKVCQKVNAHYKEIELPKFEWTRNDFYTKGENIYLEGRNLVFLSYALSYAESIGAEAIYLATLKSYGYLDTSVHFLVYVDTIASMMGITVNAPYAMSEKEDLFLIAKGYGIKYSDFFSCDKPIGEEPCHSCTDCQCLDKLFGELP